MNFQYSKHARQRRRQRGISSKEIDLTVRYGARLEDGQTWIFVPPVKGKHALKCRRFRELVVIVDAITHDIITVFRDWRHFYQKRVLGEIPWETASEGASGEYQTPTSFFYN